MFNGFLPDNSLLNDVPTFKLFLAFVNAFDELIIVFATSELIVGTSKPVTALLRLELTFRDFWIALLVNLLSLSFLS